MAGRLLLDIANPALNANGAVDSGATKTYYQNLTTTLQTIYADSTLATPLQNPLPCDAAGRFPQVWAPSDSTYSVKWTPTGASPITYDNIRPTIGQVPAGGFDLWSLPVISQLNAPPVSPASGDRYLIGASPSGAWASNAKQVAQYYANAWIFSGAPSEGTEVYLQSDGKKRIYTAGAWLLEGYKAARLTGYLAGGSSLMAGAFVHLGRAFYCDYGGSQIIVDDISGATPVNIKKFSVAANPRWVRVIFDNILMVDCYGASKVQFWDISNIHTPAKVTEILYGASPKIDCLSGDTVHFAFTDVGIIQRKRLIRHLHNGNVGGDIGSIEVLDVATVGPLSGSRKPICVADNGEGLVAAVYQNSGVVSIFNDVLTEVGSIDLNTYFSTAGITGSHCAWKTPSRLQVTTYDGTNKFITINADDPTGPSVAGYCTLPDHGSQVVPIGNLSLVAILADSGNQAYLSHIDTTTDSAPVDYYDLPLHTGGAGFLAVDDRPWVASGVVKVVVTGHSGNLTLDLVEVPVALPNEEDRRSRQLVASVGAGLGSFGQIIVGALKGLLFSQIGGTYTGTNGEELVVVVNAATYKLPPLSAVVDVPASGSGRLAFVQFLVGAGASGTAIQDSDGGSVGTLTNGYIGVAIAHSYSGTASWTVGKFPNI